MHLSEVNDVENCQNVLATRHWTLSRVDQRDVMINLVLKRVFEKLHKVAKWNCSVVVVPFAFLYPSVKYFEGFFT